MTAFLDAQADDLPDDERAELLVDHAAALERHVAGARGQGVLVRLP